MNYKAILLLLLLTSSTKVQTNQFSYAFLKYNCDQPDGCKIFDALMIINEDTMKLLYSGDNPVGYLIPSKYLRQKVSLHISHPDFEKLELDAVKIDRFRLYLFKKEDKFYTSNGQRILLKNGFQYLSLKFNEHLNITPEQYRDTVEKICQVHDLCIARDFLAEIIAFDKKYGAGASEQGYGGLHQTLKYTYWLAKNSSTSFSVNENFYQQLRAYKEVEWIGVPQNFFANISNNIVLETEKGLDSTYMDSIMAKYNLQDHWVYTDQNMDYEDHYFTVNSLIPDNSMMSELMKEAKIKSAKCEERSYIIY